MNMGTTRQLSTAQLSDNAIAMLSVEASSDLGGSGSFEHQYKDDTRISIAIYWTDNGFTGVEWYTSDEWSPFYGYDSTQIEALNNDIVNARINSWIANEITEDYINTFLDMLGLGDTGCARFLL